MPMISPTAISPHNRRGGIDWSSYWETLNLATTPIAYWELSDAVGSATVVDSSGNGLDATPSSVTLGSAGIGDGKTSGSFAGGHLAIYSAGLNAAFKGASGTLMAWSKINAAALVDGAFHYIVQIKVDASNYIIIDKTTANNQYKLIYRAGGSEDSITINDVTSTEWICWAISWDKTANEVKFYQDGIPLRPTVCTGTWAGNLLSSQTVVGKYNTTATYPWSGSIARVGIWDYALSATTIGQYFHSFGYASGFPPTLWADRAVAALTTPTYDSSGQAMHPGIYYNAAGWNGYKYWMSNTPYTGSDNDVERPSMLVSNDGTTWEVPAGGSNPIYDVTAQSDPEILVDAAGKMWVIWQQNAVPNTPMAIISSTDGITWSAAAQLFSTPFGSDVSPAVVWDGSKWLMFTVDSTVASPYVVKRRTCATPNGTWSDPVVCGGTLPAGRTHWHIDIIVSGSRLLGLFNVNANRLLYGYSDDWGLTWIYDERVFMDTATGVWDAALYRSTLLKLDANTIGIWYSAANGTTWGTGYALAHIARPERT